MWPGKSDIEIWYEYVREYMREYKNTRNINQTKYSDMLSLDRWLVLKGTEQFWQ